MTIDGITHMTDDLLGKIFYHLCAPGPLSLRHLLFVSRRFYFVAVNNAHLWAIISLDSPFVHHFRQCPEQGNKFVEYCLHRSGSLPLCLNIDHSNIDAHDLIFLLHPLETSGKPEWRGFKRCTSLIWTGSYGATTILRFVGLLPKSLPSLKHISLTSFHDVTVGSQFPNCPVLERVEILNHGAPSPHFWGTNFLHLTTLSFGNDDIWATYDLTTLSLFPRLADLTLSTASGRTSMLDVSLSCAPVLFAHLHILRARGCIPPKILSKLVAPALEELHLKANAHNITSIDALQISSNPLCQYIHVLLPMAVSAQEPEWATNLSKLVQRGNRIRSLHISRWMEGECKKFISGQGIVLYVQ